MKIAFNEEFLEQPFPIRPYNKAELASVYIRGCSHRVAMRKFNHWLRYSPDLWKRLEKSGVNIQTRSFDHTQVAMIVDHLGYP